MAISFVASSEADVPWNLFYDITAPAGMVAGDFIACAFLRSNAAALDWATYGWTLIGNYTVSASRLLGVAYRWATGSDTSWFMQAVDSSEADGVYGVCAYRGVDPVTPVANTSNSVSQTSNDIVCPAITGVPGGLALWIAGNNNGNAIGAPGGATERIDHFYATPFDHLWMADEQISSGGSTGTRTATVGTSMNWGAVSIMINAFGQPSQVRGKYIPGMRSAHKGL